jgi:ribosomal subunit interface protein
MKTLVSIPHHEYPAMVRERVEQKLQELLKYYERIVSLRAVLERQSEEHRVELVANIGHHATLVVHARGELLDTAVEEAIASMARTLRRHKTRLDDQHRRGKRVPR